MRQVVRSLLCGVALVLPMAGCHSNSQPQAAVPSGPVKQYAVKGIIVGTDPAHGEVTVDSETIPGFMDAMTMPYKVKDANVLQDLHPGDHMTGVLLVGEDKTVLDQIVITAQAQPDYKPQAQYHVPATGDAVPDFHLVNQSGRRNWLPSIPREGPARHLHLHALSALRLLPAHEPQLRCDRQEPAGRSCDL